ncbi:hypothetical protein K0M31_010109 [Melipona bicolor]|uniref:Uncharacterized protein n=1 Tax=Melipona bicolor TaxID=60889 RepID=A0AA40KIW2_9HYME|nr:hypothetical protein K0M31_010109 [Melipona bicolor]
MLGCERLSSSIAEERKRIFICRNDCSNNKNGGVGQAIAFDITLDISNLEEPAQPVLEGSGRKMGRIVMRFGKGSAKSSTYPRTPEVALGATKRYDQAVKFPTYCPSLSSWG